MERISVSSVQILVGFFRQAEWSLFTISLVILPGIFYPAQIASNFVVMVSVLQLCVSIFQWGVVNPLQVRQYGKLSISTFYTIGFTLGFVLLALVISVFLLAQSGNEFIGKFSYLIWLLIFIIALSETIRRIATINTIRSRDLKSSIFYFFLRFSPFFLFIQKISSPEYFIIVVIISCLIQILLLGKPVYLNMHKVEYIAGQNLKDGGFVEIFKNISIYILGYFTIQIFIFHLYSIGNDKVVVDIGILFRYLAPLMFFLNAYENFISVNIGKYGKSFLFNYLICFQNSRLIYLLILVLFFVFLFCINLELNFLRNLLFLSLLGVLTALGRIRISKWRNKANYNKPLLANLLIVFTVVVVNFFTPLVTDIDLLGVQLAIIICFLIRETFMILLDSNRLLAH